MFKELFTETVEKRLKIQGYPVWISYMPPKGYIAIGKSPEIKNVISKQYFDTADEAIEHATLEIEGFIDDNK